MKKQLSVGVQARRSRRHVPNSENNPGEQSRLLLRVRGADSCSTVNAGMRKRAAASAPSTRVSAAGGDGWNGSERRQVYWDSFLTARADGGAGWFGATSGRGYVQIPGSSRMTRAFSWHQRWGVWGETQTPRKDSAPTRPLNSFLNN